MGMKSSKAQQGAVTPIKVRFDGGLNYSEAASQIQDNELARALNVVYNSQTGVPETRPGTRCVTASPLANPLLKLYYYEKSSSSKWLIGVSGGYLRYLDVDTWTNIGALNDSTTVPSLSTFNANLLIADGGTNIKKWNGTAFSAISDGFGATAISEIGGRVVINSTSEPDLVIFSGVEDETMWNTADATNPAIGIRVGFGDNMAVNGFAVFGTDLIVSKCGASEKRFYRISTAGSPAEWSVSLITGNNCCQNPHSIVSAFNNIYFMDDNGFKSIMGVTEYGDLQVDMTGVKINNALNRGVCREMKYLPSFTAIWFAVFDRVYAAHRFVSAQGTPQTLFTDIMFQQGQINSIVETDDYVYLAGQNGYLYLIESAADTDEVSPAVYENYPTVVATKRFNFFGGGILRKTDVELKALEIVVTSNAYLKVNTAEQAGTTIKTINVRSSVQEIYYATGDIADATTLLGDMAGTAWIETSRSRVRGTSIQWQIDSTEGRFGLEGLTAEIALVAG